MPPALVDQERNISIVVENWLKKTPHQGSFFYLVRHVVFKTTAFLERGRFSPHPVIRNSSSNLLFSYSHSAFLVGDSSQSCIASFPFLKNNYSIAENFFVNCLLNSASQTPN